MLKKIIYINNALRHNGMKILYIVSLRCFRIIIQFIQKVLHNCLFPFYFQMAVAWVSQFFYICLCRLDEIYYVWWGLSYVSDYIVICKTTYRSSPDISFSTGEIMTDDLLLNGNIGLWIRLQGFKLTYSSKFLL